MCGIVGLFIKDETLEPKLGAMLAKMLGTMCDRGPDSAGFAVYGPSETGQAKLTIQSADTTQFSGLRSKLSDILGSPIELTSKDTHAVLRFDGNLLGKARDILRDQFPQF